MEVYFLDDSAQKDARLLMGGTLRSSGSTLRSPQNLARQYDKPQLGESAPET